MTHDANTLLERQAKAAVGQRVITTADGLPRVAFSEAEAARMIGVCSKTLANARRDGRITYRKEGVRTLYTLDDLRAYLESIKQPAAVAARGSE